jgi:hypothetical protein
MIGATRSQVIPRRRERRGFRTNEALSAMSDSGLVGFANGLLYSLGHSSSPPDQVTAEVRDGLRRVLRGGEELP